MEASQDAITATVERSFARFAEKTGLAQSDKISDTQEKNPREAEMATTATVKKTAQEGAENDMKGSQVQTTVDRGDYSPQSAEVAKQKADTAGAAPEGTPEAGNQTQSVRYDDKQYSQSGSGDAKIAKNRALAAVIAIAESDPKAAAKLVHAVDLPMGGPGGDKGQPAGGKPESVEAGEAAVVDVAPDPVAPPVTPATAPATSPVEIKLKETINDKQQQMDIEKQVVQELSKVLDEATVAAKDDKDDKKDDKKDAKEDKKDEKEDKKEAAKTAIDRSDEGKKTTKDEQGEKKVPHASVDPDDHPQKDGDPDWKLYDQSKETSEKTGEGHVGQEFATSSDMDYKHASVVEKKLAMARQVLAAKLATIMKDTGLSKEAAITELSKTELAKKYIQAKKVLIAMKKQAAENGTDREVGGNVPPDEKKQPLADDTTRYTGESKGDTGDDDVSKGTDTTKESPETGTQVDDARGNLDKKHNQDVQGATVARKLSLAECNKLIAEVGQLKRAVTATKMIAEMAVKAASTEGTRQAITQVAEKNSGALSRVSAEIHKLLAWEEGKELAPGVVLNSMARNHLAALVREGRILVESAKNNALIIKATSMETSVAKERFARVSPSFKLAMTMVQAQQIPVDELPVKVAEFIKMSANEFAVAEKMVTSISKTATRSGPPKTAASRLPYLHTGSSAMAPAKDELDGVFDDE